MLIIFYLLSCYFLLQTLKYLLHNVTNMNKWKVVRVREEIYMCLQQKADQEGRSLANYLEMILQSALGVKKNEQQ